MSLWGAHPVGVDVGTWSNSLVGTLLYYSILTSARPGTMVYEMKVVCLTFLCLLHLYHCTLAVKLCSLGPLPSSFGTTEVPY